MHRNKHVLCFIDDDPEELRRFRENLKNDLVVATGTSISEAVGDLKAKGFEKPDLFLLDLYYPEGPTSSPRELEDLAAARLEFLKAQARFLSVLASLRQSSRGGFRLAKDVWKQYRTGFAFFTRKGTLEDAIEGIDAGAVRIIKKPDPSESELQANPLSAAYDLAIETNRHHAIRDVEDAVKLSTWWWKHKEAVFAYFVGFLSSLGAGYLLHLLLKC